MTDRAVGKSVKISGAPLAVRSSRNIPDSGHHRQVKRKDVKEKQHFQRAAEQENAPYRAGTAPAPREIGCKEIRRRMEGDCLRRGPLDYGRRNDLDWRAYIAGRINITEPIGPHQPKLYPGRSRRAASRAGGEAHHESRSVYQHTVSGGLQPRGAGPGDGGAGARGARRRVRVVVVPASLADPSDADAADHAGHGLRRGPRAGHDDRAEHPDPAAAQPDACRRGSGHLGRADRRQLHPRHRPRLPPAGVRRVRHRPQGAGAAVQRKHRLDAPAVDRGPGQP